MESAYNHGSWTASFWQQMFYFNNLLQHTWTINPRTVNTISAFMNQNDAHSAAQELGSDGKAMCFSNNSGDPNGVNIGVNEPAGSCYMGALRINSNYGFESGWDEPSAEVRNTLGFADTLNRILGKHSLHRGHRPDASARGREHGLSDAADDRVWKKWNRWNHECLYQQWQRVPGRLICWATHRAICRAPAKSPMWPAGSLAPSCRTTGR